MLLSRSMLFALCFFASSAAYAADDTAWYMQNTVADRGPGMAGLCSGSFNLVIKQPQEEEDCDGFFDVLFYADLKTRKVYWSKSAVQKVDAPDYKRTVIAVLRNQMREGGSQTLDQMREFYLGSESAGADQNRIKPREVSPTVQTGRPSKRIKLTQEMLDLRCPEDIESESDRKRESLKFSQLVKAEFYRIYRASYVSETDVEDYQRQFYELRGCKQAIAALEAAEAASRVNDEKLREEQERQKKQKTAPPAVGACRVGDKLAFLGGWVVGAAGAFPFSNPVAVMERLDGASEKNRQKISEELPMRLRRGSGGIGCEGVARLKPMPVHLSQPLGGGSVKDGRYFIVAADVRGDDGKNGACYLLVERKDVTCALISSDKK